MNKYTTIIWDWGGVCCTAGEHFSNTRMLQVAGLTSEEMSNKSKDIEHSFYRGEITEEKFWKAIIARFNLKDFTIDELRESYFASSPLREEMIALIKELKKKYTSALLSNLAVDMSTRIRDQVPFNELFGVVVFSHEVGMVKPGPEIYKLILEKLGRKPEECIFIDDSKTNINAAAQLGIDGVHFQNSTQAIEELKKKLGEQ